MNYTVRDFSDGDEISLKKMWLEFIQDEEGADLNIVPCEENADRWISFLGSVIKNGNGTVKLAETESGTLAGYVFYQWGEGPLKLKRKKGVIYDLYVRPQFRNRGMGSALLKNALDDLKRRGVEIVQLTVMSKNNKALNLYKKYGFTETLKIMRLEF